MLIPILVQGINSCCEVLELWHPPDALFTFVGKVRVENETVDLLFDTGSTRTWTKPHSIPCRDQKLDLGMQKIEYVDGTIISGTFTNKTIALKSKEVLMPILYARHVYCPLNRMVQSDGILGLSPSSPFNLKRETTNPIISYYISDSLLQAFVVLDAVDTSKYYDSLEWHDSTLLEWRVDAKLQLGASLLDASVLIDSGSSLLALPQETYNLFAAEYKLNETIRSNVANIDCALKNTLPDVTLFLKSLQVTITSTDYVFSRVIGDKTVCFVGIHGAAIKPKEAILGNLFLKKLYTVFDIKNKKIGFAKPKKDSESRHFVPANYLDSPKGQSSHGFARNHQFWIALLLLL